MMNITINRRERLILIGAAVFIILFLLFQLIVAPVFQKRDDLDHKLASKRQVVEEMLTLRSEFLSLQQKSEISEKQYARRPAGFTLFSFLDQLAGTSGVKENITYMKPNSTVDNVSGLKMSYVELKLQDITLEDLTSYLFHVETSENMVRVRRLSITKEGESEGLISVVMQVETVET